MVNLLFFDLHNKDSFLKLADWVELVRENGERDALLCLVANQRAEVALITRLKLEDSGGGEQ